MGLDLNGNQIAFVPNNVSKAPATNEAPKISGKRVGEYAVNLQNSPNPASDSADSASHQNQKISSAYETRKNRTVMEEDLDKIIKQLMPDLGVRFKIHDSGQVITSVINNETEEVIREFPAEKILDLIHNMCVKLGIVVNKKL